MWDEYGRTYAEYRHREPYQALPHCRRPYTFLRDHFTDAAGAASRLRGMWRVELVEARAKMCLAFRDHVPKPIYERRRTAQPPRWLLVPLLWQQRAGQREHRRLHCMPCSLQHHVSCGTAPTQSVIPQRAVLAAS